MKKALSMLALAAVAFAGVLAQPARGDDFDNGLDIKNFVQAAVKKAGKVLVRPQSAAAQPSQADAAGQDAEKRPLRRLTAPRSGKVSLNSVQQYRYSRDCVTFTFLPEDTRSEAVWLRSEEWAEQCDYDPNRGRYCREVPRFTYREKVQIFIDDRKTPLPWEEESFRVCLEGPWVDLYEEEAAYEYSLNRGNSRNGIFHIAPGKKVAMSPDFNGLKLEYFGMDDDKKNFKMVFHDKWARHYDEAGDATEIWIDLRHVLSGRTDPTVFETRVRLSTTKDRFEIRFAELPVEFKEALKPGDKYHVDWSFKRLGKLSSDKEQKHPSKDPEKDDVVFLPAGPAL
ncbi:MAG: hypothetical protein A3G41_08975 [Elusimicrobia bacterium RIFCSPLOWO2_12_FULL_59_9]|nr:MAG: hypothetical protein A3G41_08975 [Elusimicrobia bacterium RIFCSPLOWO2_12_FULL_59_9]